MGKKIIKFGADWCQPCHILDKTLDEINKERPIEIEKVDAEYPNWRDANLIETYKIKSIPVMLFMDGEELLERIEGNISKTEIIKRLDNFKF